jgi:hypothetical protein
MNQADMGGFEGRSSKGARTVCRTCMEGMQQNALPERAAVTILASIQRRTDMGIMTQLRGAIRRSAQKTPEQAYLDAATSQVDLEMRQREIDRHRFAARHPYY